MKLQPPPHRRVPILKITPPPLYRRDRSLPEPRAPPRHRKRNSRAPRGAPHRPHAAEPGCALSSCGSRSRGALRSPPRRCLSHCGKLPRRGKPTISQSWGKTGTRPDLRIHEEDGNPEKAYRTKGKKKPFAVRKPAALRSAAAARAPPTAELQRSAPHGAAPPYRALPPASHPIPPHPPHHRRGTGAPPCAGRSSAAAPRGMADGGQRRTSAPRDPRAPLLTALQGAAQRPALRLRADLPDHHQQRVPPRLPAARSARQPGRCRLHSDRPGRRLHGNATAAAAARRDWRAALKAPRAPPRLAPLPRGAALLRRTEAWPEGRGSEVAPRARRRAVFPGALLPRRAQSSRWSLGSGGAGSPQAQGLPHGPTAGAEAPGRAGPGHAQSACALRC